MIIRKAEDKDMGVLVANRLEFIKCMRNNEVVISEEFKNDTYEYLKKHIEDASMVAWIAVDNEVIAASAFVCYYTLLPMMSNPSGKTGYIMNVYTSPDYRRQGLASKLIEKIKQDAKEKGVKKLYLDATDMGRPVYEKLGFELLTREMVFIVD